MKKHHALVGTLAASLFVLVSFAFPAPVHGGQSSLVFEGKEGPGKGKHIVLLSGDEEYRSEESMPMLAKILSQRHGFTCTVLFALDSDGTINPNNKNSLPDAEALDSADAIVMLLRHRNWPPEQMKHFVDAYSRGVPIIGLRTATHAFSIPDGPYQSFSTFGKRVLGEGWVSHWGRHKVEGTKAIVEPSAKDDPILSGVADVFGTTDVYEAYPASDAKILFRGQVLKGLKADDAPADYKKARATDKQEQGINDPMMPVAWTRQFKNEAGKLNKILCTTMGAATDLENEGLRRLVVNSVYWGLGMDVPAKADVTLVDPYNPPTFGFNGFRKGLKPDDFALGKSPAAEAKSAEGRNADAQPEAGKKAFAAVSSVKDSFGAASSGPLTLKPDDHIAIIGNTLADRMQHDGYFETLIVAQHPKDNLVFRNLAVPGDEVVTRARSENFGTPDDWLTRVKADVIFAFFGFNESFKGPDGVASFKSDLDKFLKETAGKNYSGKGAPKVVLFSPIANERIQDPNYPDPEKNNVNIQLYTAAMADVAKANGVQFVDLFAPSQDLYAAAAKQGKSLTLNGLHLLPEGDKALAPLMFRGVFGDAAPAGDFEKLRAAIIDKNEMWHSRYRTVDGYNVYGGRSKMAYDSGKNGAKITNYEVMQQEMSQRDVMTANRDKRVWGLARGNDNKVDDSNLPPVEKLVTNHPGPNPDKSWPYLSGEKAIGLMKVPDHCKVNLFASEEQFPELVKPVQMAWDTKGRLWVSVWPNYPERTPTSKVGDSILIFEDTKGTGHADKCTHFIDDLNCPTGFQFYKDGILLMQAPDLWFVRSTDGSGNANWKERVLMGMDSADSHHTTNSMVLEPGGATYLSDGVFHRTQVETAIGPVRNEDACIYRFEPNTGKFERYAPYAFANPHGRVFDYWGSDIISDATGNNSYFGPAISGHLDSGKHPGMKQFWERPSRPCPGTGILTSPSFPAEFQGNFLNCNVIGFQGIYRVKINEDGSGISGATLENLVSSSDPNFRPTGVNVGPDGAVYFMDWSNDIIGHLQHHLRDPNRDHVHGRIYRMVYEGLPLQKPVKIDGQPIPALLELLKAPENQTRTLAKIELGKHDDAQVAAAVKAWAAALDKNDPAYEHNMTEALWVLQWHNVVDHDLLVRMLRSPEPHARAAATRVLCYWRDRVSDAVELLKVQAADESPRVRLEAVRAASFFTTPDAVDVALGVQKLPTDYYLDYVIKETMRQLQPLVGKAIAANPDDIKLVIKTTSTPELMKLPKTEPVLETIMLRPDTPDAARNEAVIALAKLKKTTGASVLIDTIESAGKTDPASVISLLRLLPIQSADDLKAQKDRLTGLTTSGASHEIRGTAWGALAVSDDSFDSAWEAASKSTPALGDLLTGIPLISDLSFRGKAYDKVSPLLAPGFPAGLAASLKPAPADTDKKAIRTAAIRAAVSMGKQQEATFDALVSLIEKNDLAAAATQGLLALPRSAWDPAQAGPAVTALIARAKAVPVNSRDSQDYVEGVQLATDLTAAMPSEQGAAARKELKELRVAVFVVKTVSEQMRYDTTRLVVEAGKPFEVIFQNADNMPHNFVVVKPGSREAIGKASANMKYNETDKDGRLYIPKSKDILNGTQLLEPGQKTTLKVTAPTHDGDYEYMCTYPGHWEMMWGKLIVVKDVDAYLQSHPESAGPSADMHGMKHHQ